MRLKLFLLVLFITPLTFTSELCRLSFKEANYAFCGGFKHGNTLTTAAHCLSHKSEKKIVAHCGKKTYSLSIKSIKERSSESFHSYIRTDKAQALLTFEKKHSLKSIGKIPKLKVSRNHKDTLQFFNKLELMDFYQTSISIRNSITQKTSKLSRSDQSYYALKISSQCFV